MSVKFSAGRFRVECYIGPENGRATTLIELNHSGEEAARIRIGEDDLPDIEHVLKRAIYAHANYRIERKA